MSAIDGLRRSIVGRLGACSLEELRVLDNQLTHIELERDGSAPRGSRLIPQHRLVAHLHQDRYDEREGDDWTQAYKRGWNDCSANTERFANQGSVEAGLRELREVVG